MMDDAELNDKKIEELTSDLDGINITDHQTLIYEFDNLLKDPSNRVSILTTHTTERTRFFQDINTVLSKDYCYIK